MAGILFSCFSSTVETKSNAVMESPNLDRSAYSSMDSDILESSESHVPSDKNDFEVSYYYNTDDPYPEYESHSPYGDFTSPDDLDLWKPGVKTDSNNMYLADPVNFGQSNKTPYQCLRLTTGGSNKDRAIVKRYFSISPVFKTATLNIQYRVLSEEFNFISQKLLQDNNYNYKFNDQIKIILEAQKKQTDDENFVNEVNIVDLTVQDLGSEDIFLVPKDNIKSLFKTYATGLRQVAYRLPDNFKGRGLILKILVLDAYPEGEYDSYGDTSIDIIFFSVIHLPYFLKNPIKPSWWEGWHHSTVFW